MSVMVAVATLADPLAMTPISLPIAIAIAIAIANSDAAGTDRDLGLCQRNGLLGSDRSACGRRECREAERRRKQKSKRFHEILQFSCHHNKSNVI
jgi:hypothetical protein